MKRFWAACMGSTLWLAGCGETPPTPPATTPAGNHYSEAATTPAADSPEGAKSEPALSSAIPALDPREQLLVGTWHGGWLGRTLRVSFHADHTFREVERHGTGTPHVATGTWKLVGNQLEETFTASPIASIVGQTQAVTIRKLDATTFEAERDFVDITMKRIEE